MMKYGEREIKVVIGASYGDEGKGLMTYHFCKEAKKGGKACLTVLHNGGAQRGHTVRAENGVRHVFHHLSSGTFSASDTFFAKTFIINPMVFAEEHSGLLPDTKIYCSPECRWSTPFDMMINQIIEDRRGNARHGSCGFGIWETAVRYENSAAVSFPEFITMSRSGKIGYLKNIRDKYLPARLHALGVSELSDEWRKTIYGEGLIDNFISDCEYFSENTAMTDERILEEYPYIVFEGAQGLLLSSDLGENERYTTPSFTGAENPIEMISGLSGKSDVEVCYVTRTYITRHGAGPLENECPKDEINHDMRDLTNIPNGYQGTLRYGRLDVKKLRDRISADFDKFRAIPDVRMSLAVTHLNETDGMIVTPDGYVSPESVGAGGLYLSWREDMAEPSARRFAAAAASS